MDVESVNYETMLLPLTWIMQYSQYVIKKIESTWGQIKIWGKWSTTPDCFQMVKHVYKINYY